MRGIFKCLFFCCLLSQLLSETMGEEPKRCNQHNSTEVETVDDEPPCIDTHHKCEYWAEEGECRENEAYMLIACPCSCDSCPSYTKNEWDDESQYAMGPLKEEIEYVIQQTEEYMAQYSYFFSANYNYCRNKYAGCSHWSLLGKHYSSEKSHLLSFHLIKTYCPCVPCR